MDINRLRKDIEDVQLSLEMGMVENAENQLDLILLDVKEAQQSMHPTSETLRRLLALSTPEQLSALEVLLTPLTAGNTAVRRHADNKENIK